MVPMEFQRKIEENISSLKAGEVYRAVINDTEKYLIEKALERTCGNQILAARYLGLNRNTIRSKMKKLHINPVQFRGLREKLMSIFLVKENE